MPPWKDFTQEHKDYVRELRAQGWSLPRRDDSGCVLRLAASFQWGWRSRYWSSFVVVSLSVGCRGSQERKAVVIEELV